MTAIEMICIITAVIVIVTAGGLLFRNYINTKRLLEQLQNMVNEAITGELRENRYDESRVSALEIKLKQFLQKSLQSAEKLREEKENTYTLISDISHQTKTPIANISIYSQLLLEHDLPEESKACTSQIAAQVHKLQFLIESLIKMSRLENGMIAIVSKENNVEMMLRQAVEQLMIKAGQKHVQLEIAVENTADTAYFDLRWTVEAIYNIVDNAVKYTKVYDTISIVGMPYELFYRLDITDHGMGISEAEQNKIFARFYRSERVKEAEGVGVGLFLTYQIILLEQGYIKVKSEIDKGTTFSVFLPRRAV